VAALAPAYRPRRPTETVLYEVVRRHLETFLAYARETYAAPLPRYVEEELRGYLRCGVFAYGFVRCHCDTCGHDLLVAFSCHGRSICPSCCGRRMANVAAHLVDRVLPAVPIRQWVLTLPFELRALAAFRAEVLTALNRMFVEAVFKRYSAWAKRQGLPDAPTGAVTHIQRFGSSVNLNVHFHSMLLDGVFTRDDSGGLRFHAAPPPTREELSDVVRRVHRRAVAWLAKKKLIETSSDPAASQEPTAQTSIDACAAIAMQRGALRKLPDLAEAEHEAAAVDPLPRDDGVAELDGFNLHASVAVARDDDLSRERLMRYGARPPLALDRLRWLPGGRIGYRIKKLRDGRAKMRVMTPLEFLARLSAIVPPPRYPLLRYAGVLGPRSPWRGDVVPRAPEAKSTPCDPARPRPDARGQPGPTTEPRSGRTPTAGGAGHGDRLPPSSPPPRPNIVEASPARSPAPVAITVDAPAKGAGQWLTPNVIGVKHWNRLLGGVLYAQSARIDWPSLLRRTFDVDVLACPSCRGRLRVLAEVTNLAMVKLALESVGVAAEAPRAARARDPTELLGEAPTD